MDIYRFIESPELAVWLREICYHFSVRERAALVALCDGVSSRERQKAWGELLPEARPAEADALRRAIERETALEEAFLRPGENAVYRVDALDDLGFDLPGRAYPTLRACLETCRASAAFREGAIRCLTVIRQWLDEPIREIEAEIDCGGELLHLRQLAPAPALSPDDPAGWPLRLPSPFHRGDAVWDPLQFGANSDHREPMVLLEEPDETDGAALCLWGGLFGDAQLAAVPCRRLRSYHLDPDDSWERRLLQAGELLRGSLSITGFLTEERWDEQKGERRMEQYQLTIEDGIVTDIRTFREIPGAEGELPEVEEIRAELFVPAEVRDFDTDALVGIAPTGIRADPANPAFRSVDDCLLRRADDALVMGCGASVLREEAGIRQIGPCAFNYVRDVTAMGPEIRVPRTVRSLEYRSFCVSSDGPIRLLLPETLERVGEMALMMDSAAPPCEIVFQGDPALSVGAFGTKAEAADSDNEIYRNMPEPVYTRPETLQVYGPRGSGVADYCRRYGIPFTPLEA